MHHPLTRWPRLLLGCLLAAGLAGCNDHDDGDGDADTPPAPTAPAPTVALTATPDALTLGAATMLNWTTSNATACIATGAWSGSRAVGGSEAFTPAAAGRLAYTLTCSGPGGSGSATATVTVNPVPTLSLVAAPSTLRLGASSTLTWSSSNTTGCVASGDWTGTRNADGAEVVTPGTVGNTNYTLACTGPGGTATATAALRVEPADVVSLTFEGRAVSAGGPTGDGGLANAAIRVSAGGQTFTGTADPSGRFSIPVTIPASEQDRLVRIVASEPSDTPVVVYVSQLASFRTLLAQAGADLTLSADENFRVNVSNVATAETALVQEAAFGFPLEASDVRPPLRAASARPRVWPVDSIATNDQELDAALMSINQTELLDIAVSLSLVADRGFALPPDIDSTLGLALTPDARQRFIDAVRNGANAAVIGDTLNSLLGNRAAVMGATPATVPRTAVAALTGASTEENLISNRNSVMAEMGFRFSADGSGTYTNGTYASDDTRWSVNETGTIEIRFATPPSFSFEQGIDDPGAENGLRTIICTRSLTGLLPVS